MCSLFFYFGIKKKTFAMDWIFELREAIVKSLDFLKIRRSLLFRNIRTIWISMSVAQTPAMDVFLIWIG